jgi:hypothetical protein
VKTLCNQKNNGIRCNMLREGSEKLCPDCNPRPASCHCGNGYVVVVDFGSGPTNCCTCTISKFEAIHGKFKWQIFGESMK